MINTNTLRVGQHILAGKVYDSYAVPKHMEQICTIGTNWVCCISSEDSDGEYDYSEIDGIPITADILERSGFKRSGLNVTKWYLATDAVRITYDEFRGGVIANGISRCERNDVHYVHELESALCDAGIEMNLKLTHND